jgi:glycosyltransferase involved in cell wall biosynthesis
MGDTINKRVLLIAFHFPPFHGSSGSLRTLNFSRYLPQFGWEPMVLTAHPRAYPNVEPGSVKLIPSQVPVTRAFALDAAQHFSWNGRYLDWTAVPDRWGSWVLGAVPAALRLIRRWKPRAIWSTYPIVTAHVIGAIVQRLTKIPWIADFRDPMVEYDAVKNEYWPSEPRVRAMRTNVERLVMKYSTRTVFVTPSALESYAQRFSTVDKKRFILIPNGYDEESFTAAEKLPLVANPRTEQLVLLHSGGLYSESGRDTTFFFAALAELRQHGEVSPTTLRIVLRASNDHDNQQRLIRQYRLEDVVFLEPAIPYVDALAEMLQVNGLLLFQGSLTNTQIPAKVYEYLRARRPILAVVDPTGDTAAFLRNVGVGVICSWQEKDAIVRGVREFLTQVRQQRASTAHMAQIMGFSRESGTGELARLLDEVGCR